MSRLVAFLRLALFLAPDGSLPGWVGIELMAQSIAAWSGYQGWLRGEPPQIGLLLGARKYEALLPRLPAEALLTIEVSQLLRDGGLSSFNCLIYCAGERVAEREDLKQAMERMLSSDGPFVLEVVVEKEANVFPMIPAGSGVSEVRLR